VKRSINSISNREVSYHNWNVPKGSSISSVNKPPSKNAGPGNNEEFSQEQQEGADDSYGSYSKNIGKN
jgi:hypothetical protein